MILSEVVEKLHFNTIPETSEPTRSDCHGWSAYILYHLYATIAVTIMGCLRKTLTGQSHCIRIYAEYGISPERFRKFV